ncbi:MAG: hypothetical protein M9894_26140 [Planctomycetes bacterium]|nr:hypothetical protein [Planctomycetota bacterium]
MHRAHGLALLIALCGCPGPGEPAKQQVSVGVVSADEHGAAWGLIGDRSPIVGRTSDAGHEVEVGLDLHARGAARVSGALFRVRPGQDLDEAVASAPVAEAEGLRLGEDGRWRVVFPVRPADGVEWVVAVVAEDPTGRRERVVVTTSAYCVDG